MSEKQKPCAKIWKNAKSNRKPYKKNPKQRK
nr:MAG TPA: hypothetical protein [Caudoviricetes sp.]